MKNFTTCNIEKESFLEIYFTDNKTNQKISCDAFFFWN